MIRIGFDIGGSKLAAIALDRDGRELARRRGPVPTTYAATLADMVDLVGALERAHGSAASVGIAIPGMIGSGGELLRAVNLTWLEGRPLARDLEQATGTRVTLANDANCFALSEATDGAAAGASVVFAAVLGTGVGGAIAIERRPLTGANAIAGEWGHNPLPQILAEDGPPAPCGCGRLGCIESWLNGAALRRDYLRASGREADPHEIVDLAAAGKEAAQGALGRYQRRLAAALGTIINILDPDVIVLGGGLSEIASLYDEVPKLWGVHTVAPEPKTRLVRARFGPESGLRGAAWLGG